MENIYKSQKYGIKKKLYEFIETSNSPYDKNLALLLIQTIRFIDQSEVFRYPEFTLDEDFGLCLDWVKDKNNSFSLSISKNGVCSYAYIKQYGEFFRDERDRKGNGNFKVGSADLYDFKTSMNIILGDIYHE